MRLGHLALGAALLCACATPPKPRELQAFEELRLSPMAAEAARRAPDLVTTANRFGERAKEEWESDDLPESRRDALLAYIKLKTAIAIAEQQEARARLTQLDGEMKAAQQEQAAAARELQQEEDRVAALKKLLRSRGETDRVAAEEQKRKLEQQNAEQQKKSATEAVAAAELAMKSAEALEAGKHAAGDHAAAQALLVRAREDLNKGNWTAASAGADQARYRADAAARTARPLFEQAARARAAQERADSMAREAETLSGVTLRRDRRGDVERMSLTIENLFPGAKTKLQPGGDALLDGVARWLNKHASYQVQVIGHTDSKGVPAKLTELSLARASAVQTLLVARGVDPARMTVNGLGADEPIANNRTASGRARNNRIEIVLLYK